MLENLINLTCPSCHKCEVIKVYDFGNVPLAGYFPIPGKSENKFYPMTLNCCANCQLMFVSPDISDRLLFEDYRYVSSVGMQKHFDEFAKWYVDYFSNFEKQHVYEIGSNDGPLLSALREEGINAIGIDPATNIVNLARKKGLKVINEPFNAEFLINHNFIGKADVIIACNSFAHISNISEIAESVSRSLSKDGFFIVEVQSIYEMVKGNSFDFIYHEHKYYYSLESIEYLMNQFELYLIDGFQIDTHGGSYRLIFSKGPTDKSKQLIQLEIRENDGSLSLNNIQNQINKFHSEIIKLSRFLQILVKDNKTICGFGASGRANMLLHYLGLPRETISVVFDESEERIDREMANSQILVKKFVEGMQLNFDYCLILAWNYEFEIRSKINGSMEVIVPLPIFKVG